MDSKTVKLNCLTLGELENEHISKKKWSVPLIEKCTYTDYIIKEDLYFFLFSLVFKLSADIFLMSVSWFIVVTHPIHGDCMRRQKAHPKMMGVGYFKFFPQKKKKRIVRACHTVSAIILPHSS